MLWLIIKIQLLLFVFIWLRGTLPRLRYDQFMKLGWKVLIPVSLVWLLLVATVRALRNQGHNFGDVVLYVAGGVVVLVLLSVLFDMLRPKKQEPAEAGAGQEPFDPMAGGFPVPPMPGQQLPAVPRRPSRAASTTVPALKGDDGA
jgi:NADH-quinone oxidoreductase subunit H